MSNNNTNILTAVIVSSCLGLIIPLALDIIHSKNQTIKPMIDNRSTEERLKEVHIFLRTPRVP